jgi:hypothetical protein
MSLAVEGLTPKDLRLNRNVTQLEGNNEHS